MGEKAGKKARPQKDFVCLFFLEDEGNLNSDFAGCKRTGSD